MIEDDISLRSNLTSLTPRSPTTPRMYAHSRKHTTPRTHITPRTHTTPHSIMQNHQRQFLGNSMRTTKMLVVKK